MKICLVAIASALMLLPPALALPDAVPAPCGAPAPVVAACVVPLDDGWGAFLSAQACPEPVATPAASVTSCTTADADATIYGPADPTAINASEPLGVRLVLSAETVDCFKAATACPTVRVTHTGRHVSGTITVSRYSSSSPVFWTSTFDGQRGWRCALTADAVPTVACAPPYWEKFDCVDVDVTAATLTSDAQVRGGSICHAGGPTAQTSDVSGAGNWATTPKEFLGWMDAFACSAAPTAGYAQATGWYSVTCEVS